MIRVLSLLLCCLAVLWCRAEGYRTFEENGKIGMKDDTGNVVLPPAFEALGWSDGNFSVIGEVTGYRLNGLWGMISLKKEFITEAAYEGLVYNGGDRIVARKKINAVYSKTGCINLKGEIKIPFVYDGISIQGLRAIVFNLSKAHYSYGLTDLTNQILIPVVYRNIRPLGTLRFAVENTENKIALFDDEGKSITGFLIDSISDFHKNFARIYQNHWQGLIDRTGAIKLEAKYNSIKVDEAGNVDAKLPNEWLFINNKNERVKQFFAEELKPLNEKLLIIRRGRIFGLIDWELRPVIPVEYESLSEIGSEKYLVKKNNKLGVIDQNNKTIVPFLYDSLVYDHPVYRAFIRNQGWRLLNATGKELTGRYDKLQFPDRMGFPALKKGFSGMVDFEGREFIHCVFDSIARPVDGLMAVKFKGKYGVISADEDWILPPQDFSLAVVNARRYVLHQPSNHFVKSFTGEIIYFTPYPLKFYAENFIELLPDGKERTITYDGEILQHEEPSPGVTRFFSESEGLRGIKKDDRYGFVDDRGRLRVANRYDSIGEFHEGLASVKLIGKWGFVNTNDQIVINPNYDNCSFFQHGMAIVSRNKKFGLIEKNGKVALPLRYDFVTLLPDATYLIGVSHLQGLADRNGSVLVETKYDSIGSTKNNILIVCRDGKRGSITDHGVNMIPMIYDQLLFIDAQMIFLAEKKSEWKRIEVK